MTEFFLTKQDTADTGKERLLKVYAGLKAGSYIARFERAGKRSSRQNRFYWLIMTEYIQPGLYNLGYRQIKTKDDAHRFCCNEFLKVQVVNELTGEVKEHVRSTTELTTLEWEEYREDLNQFASEYLGIVLPDPQEQIKMFQ